MNDLATIFQSAWGILLIVLFFGGSIFVHELGHFLAARWRGLVIERFSIGFGPRLFGWKGKDGVDYRVSLLPLGGYVALPQLADMQGIEGKNEKSSDQLPPISYADKMIVAVAGAVFNILFALLLATAVWVFGHPEPKSMQTTEVGYVSQQVQISEETAVPGPAWKAGLRPGDVITAVDGSTVRSWRDVQELIITGTGRSDAGNPTVTVTIERNGEPQTLQIHPVLMASNRSLDERIRHVGIAPADEIIVARVYENSPAEKAGLIEGDKVLTVDGQEVPHLQVLNDILENKAGEAVPFTVLREEAQKELALTPRRVAITKPLAAITFTTDGEETASVQLEPVYDEDIEGSPTSPATPARLRVFQAPDDYRHVGFIPGRWFSKINGESVTSVDQFVEVFNQPREKGTYVTMTDPGGGEERIIIPANAKASVVPPLEDTLVGFQMRQEYVTTYPNPFEQFRQHILSVKRVLTGIVNPQSDISPLNLSGPVGIARIYWIFSREGLLLVIWFTVFLNVNLAMVNLLPIPVLDGGHMLYATIAKIMRRPLPANFIAATQGLFVVALFGFIIVLVFRDVMRWSEDASYISESERMQSYRIEDPFAQD